MIPGRRLQHRGRHVHAQHGRGRGRHDGHGSVLFLTGYWAVYKLPFSEIEQAGWATRRPSTSNT